MSGKRSATATRFAPDTHARLKALAERYGVSQNLLINRAVVRFLDEAENESQLVLFPQNGDGENGDAS